MGVGRMDADFDAARMRESLRLAARAAKRGEVPVGALVVKDGKVIGRGCSRNSSRRGAMPRIEISIPEQNLALLENGREIRRYAVSTSRNGAGERQGSFCTPRGEHIVRAKIGAGQPLNTVFVERRPTGEIWTSELAERFPGRDWILTRILWLSGCEPGKNRMGEVDTMRRYIYIHGSPDAVEMGKPGSIGCIRMRNRDILELFELVPAGTQVSIAE